MASGYEDDGDFDWEAAVAEIDKACDKSQQSKASNKYCQKTLDAFLKLNEPRSLVQETIHIDGEEGGRRKESAADLDPSAFRTWVYPANIPCRQYQFSITKTALFTNTIVALPTGLGKTLIAAVVMYNYFRWFPMGKIVFTAPSKPLVVQQIEACHNVMGIPQEFTIDMTGQMSPPQRAEHWQSQRIFFVTPQVLEKDIQTGICPMKEMVCLVVDEAHRATGNYSYCVVIRELLAANVQLRILALTATPGSKQATVQAVLDNLQISCLEYRDENDPDVRLYTHNRELELIQVPMNAESNKIKDTFVEILIPLIGKLCDLGVFYTRDLARISPYELIMARDKFRQAPPDALCQGQYREVECGFGGAITLCHILKLLHSHGIRPALEMLLAKLQQGSLRQLGKNSKLQKVKGMMQESVGHGAPSPKLVKLEEIILSHFSQHNPLETRVIIFTNFRESVKDILETLTKVQHVVKATEFIGQTSGKSSKGQTQKTQQAVLQKFRAGGYNTIVATCIAEEGLDIMEVDLVICFDANVSPIRMIQRMGRTGRKRDGRVVVLATEGAETQGYQKKQAKNKALIKYMQHGGVNTFTFHPSPRMVPHVYKPEVQMMEMSIKSFVPRGRKLRTETASSLDPGADEPTEEEHALLQKYAQQPGEMPWKPSLIAFPSFQLLPTPIYAVKHSVRTVSMLIDVLQGLQEPAFHCTSKVMPFSKSEISTSGNCRLPPDGNTAGLLSVIAEDSADQARVNTNGKAGWDQEYSPVDNPIEVLAPKVDNMDFHQADQGMSGDVAGFGITSIVISDSQLDKKDPHSPTLPTSGIFTGENKVQCTSANSLLEPIYSKQEGVQEMAAKDDNDNSLHGLDFVKTRQVKGQKSQLEGNVGDEMLGFSTSQPLASLSENPNLIRSHRFLFHTEVVYMNAAGLLVIASPPKWPIVEVLTSSGIYQEGTKASLSHTKSNLHTTKVMSIKCEEYKTFAEVDRLREGNTHNYCVAATNFRVSEKLFGGIGCRMMDLESPQFPKPCSSAIKMTMQPSVDFVASTPEGKPPHSSTGYHVTFVAETPNLQSRLNSSPLPRIASLSTSFPSPILETPVVSKTHKTSLASPKHISPLPFPSLSPEQLVTPADLKQSLQYSANLMTCDTMEVQGGLENCKVAAENGFLPVSSVPETGHTLGAGPSGRTTSLSLVGTQIGNPQLLPDLPHGKQKSLTLSEQQRQLNVSQVSQCQLRGNGTTEEMGEPESSRRGLEYSSEISDDEGVKSSTGVLASVRRKFKRLKKACQLIVPTPAEPENDKQILQCSGGKEHARVQKTKSMISGKYRRKLAVRTFIEDEAEVSSDEDVSTDEDDSIEGNGSLEGFIDSSHSQHLQTGSVDMMAIYRRSLLTQSPMEQWQCFLPAQSNTPCGLIPETTVSSTTGGSDSKQTVELNSASRPSSSCPTPSFAGVSLNNGLASRSQHTSVCDEDRANIKKIGRVAASVPDTSSVQRVEQKTRKKLGLRKRKLSFQPPVEEDDDDDVFAGIDLDALEQDAVLQARTRVTQLDSMPSFDLGIGS